MDPPTQPPPDYELSIFSYRHTILATGPVETNWSDSVLFELHHWHPPMARKLTSARLPLSTLSGLKDSVSLGTFSVPVDVDHPRVLSGLLESSSSNTHRDLNPNSPQTLSDLVRELNEGSESEEMQRQFSPFPSSATLPILSSARISSRYGSGSNATACTERPVSGRPIYTRPSKTGSGTVART